MKRYKTFSDPHVITRNDLEASIDRDERRSRSDPVKPSSSASPRRCGFCREWREPKGERCSVCRQKFDALPLQGLKAAG